MDFGNRSTYIVYGLWVWTLKQKLVYNMYVRVWTLETEVHILGMDFGYGL